MRVATGPAGRKTTTTYVPMSERIASVREPGGELPPGGRTA